MLRTLSIAAVGAALALPAAAETTVKVDVAGLDAPAAHARIFQAAKAACRVELRNSTTFEQYYQWNGCINDAVARAESDLKTQQASTAGGALLAGR
jgi:UrcA family protein